MARGVPTPWVPEIFVNHLHGTLHAYTVLGTIIAYVTLLPHRIAYTTSTVLQFPCQLTVRCSRRVEHFGGVVNDALF